MAELIFQDEDQLIAAEGAYDTAVRRALQKCPEKAEPDDAFLNALWNNIALTVIHDGYAAAMSYARNADFNVKQHLKHTEANYER